MNDIINDTREKMAEETRKVKEMSRQILSERAGRGRKGYCMREYTSLTANDFL